MKENEKGGEMHIFSPVGKKYAYFFPNWRKIYKIAQKKPDNFSPAARSTSLYQISSGEKI